MQEATVRRIVSSLARMVRDSLACLLVFVLSPLLPTHVQTAEEETLAELPPKVKLVCASQVVLGQVTTSIPGEKLIPLVAVAALFNESGSSLIAQGEGNCIARQ
jgi:hypothetical protein